MRLAWRIAATVLGCAALVGVGAVLLNPPLWFSLILWGNVAIAAWWALHLMFTRRPW